MKILVTGGAGFIGSHLIDRLLENGHQIRVFDNLDPQVHRDKAWPAYLSPKTERIKGDVCDREQFKKTIQGMDAVVHLAAAVGVGQSMYQIEHYTRANILGTSMLWDILGNERHSVKKVVIASSMSAYGEGLYRCPSCGIKRGDLRPDEQLKAKKWELLCPTCGKTLQSIPIPETEPFHCYSLYALTKKYQEEICLMLGRVYNISTTALRFFNVYGPRQSLSNPYTGVAAIFLSRIKNNLPPVVYEDGGQTRDFISVYDLVRGIEMSLTKKEADYEIFNLGTGRPIAIKALGELLAKEMGSAVKPMVANSYRMGDVRHCIADVSKVRAKLGWEPETSLEEGMRDLCKWAKTAEAADFFEEAAKHLAERGLLK